MIGEGDAFHLPYDNVYELCIRYARGISKIGKNSREISSQFLKSATKACLNLQLDDL